MTNICPRCGGEMWYCDPKRGSIACDLWPRIEIHVFACNHCHVKKEVILRNAGVEYQENAKDFELVSDEPESETLPIRSDEKCGFLHNRLDIVTGTQYEDLCHISSHSACVGAEKCPIHRIMVALERMAKND